LFRYREGVVYLDAKVPDRTFDFGVAEQKLHRSQIACAPVNQGRLRPPERMGAEELRV
jgi:deoxyxylulose-5-phosphate synthase